MTFITKLVRYTNVYTGTLMSTIIYMNRLRSKLPKDARGLPCTRHRIFLACLIIASKNLNDSSPKNKHWAKYTDGLFRKEDVNLMERQLLMLLDWDVQIDNAELVHAWKRFLDPIKSDLKKNSRIRNNLSKGMLVGSTQTIVVPKETLVSPVTSDSESDIDASASTSSLSLHSRNTSVSSSIYSANSLHSRASSVSSLESQSQQNSSVHNVSKLLPVSYNNNNNNNDNSNTQLKKALNSLNANTPISNYLKSVAMKEEQELNDLIREYCGY
jgi:PHO85 cyclin-1